MSTPRQWKLVFTCPECQRASQVAAEKMGATVSCPHCHTSVVIDRDGIHDAAKRRRQKRRERPSKPEEFEYHSSPSDNVGRGWLWAGLFLLLLVAAIPLASWWSGYHVPDDSDKLYFAAKTFQSAWLEDDLDTAGTFVLSSDLDRLQEWSAPRRASLVAGFGSSFRGRVTTVEIVENAGEHAAVRVAFEIGGREQQVFQDWRLVEENWRLSLR